ncbi:MAG TPA: DUF3857 domain-containing protein [Bacteroidales bacterium]
MKTRILLITMLCAMTFSVASAQKVPIHWGKLLSTDTSMRVYKSDPKAPAVVLCDFGTADVGPRTEYTRHVRVKILKDDGLKYGTVEIPYKFYDYYDIFSGLKAQTINVEANGKLVRTKVKPRNIEDIQTDRWNKKKVLHFPNVKVGSIIEYSYTIRSLDLVKLRDWYFQSTIPVIWSEYRVYISRRFNYLVTFQKGRALDYDEQKAFADRLQWLYDTKIKAARRELMGKKYVLYESPKGTIKVYYAQGESYTFIMNDMPPFEPQRGVYALTDYFPAVKVHLYLADGNYPFFYRRILAAAREDYDWRNDRQSYYNSFIGYVAYWLPTWDEATKRWLDSERFGKRLMKGVDFKPQFDTNASEIDKIKSIYQYVKDNVQWDGTYSMYTDRDLSDILKKKTGSSGEINLLLINLLRRSGINANPVILRTRDMGRPENVYPVHNQFNHVIAFVESGGQQLFLDASGTKSSFNNLPWNVDGALGFLVTKENYKWIDIDENQVPTTTPTESKSL